MHVYGSFLAGAGTILCRVAILIACTVSCFVTSTAFAEESYDDWRVPPTDHPFALPRFGEGSSGEAMNKYFDVGVDGDLRISIPLFTVPGKLPVPLNLSYKSGIKLDQSASWVGLGWNLGGWSVQRVTVNGDDVHSYMCDSTQSRFFINDEYVVSIPGRTIKFINTGTMHEPKFVPQSFGLDSLYVAADSAETVIGIGNWFYNKYRYFILVDANATRYVFKQPLRRTTIGEPRHDYLKYWPELWDVAIWPELANMTENSEWLLTAMLSHDYVDGGGDPLDPLDSQYPRTENMGSWVAFKYTGGGLAEEVPHIIERGVWDCGDVVDNHKDTTELLYLNKIITPSVVVDFELHPAANFATIDYYRSGENTLNPRHKALLLTQVKVYSYSGTGTESDGPELYGVSFEYEVDNHLPLKWNWHRSFSRHAHDFTGSFTCTRHGEPTLRAISIGALLSYQSGESELKRPSFDSGPRRRFTFKYDDTLDNDRTLWSYFYDDRRTYDSHTSWAYGKDHPDCNMTYLVGQFSSYYNILLRAS